MKMFIAGKWVDRDNRIDVLNPFDGSVIDTVPNGTPADVDAAIASAERGAQIMSSMPAYERYKILHRAGEIMTERVADLGQTITLEEGKVIAEGMGEAARAQETIELSAEEAASYRRDTRFKRSIKWRWQVRLHATHCGVVAAITPFNFPLNLVCHRRVPPWPVTRLLLNLPQTHPFLLSNS